MLKEKYQKAMVTLGLLMAGVTPSFAGLEVSDFEKANLEKGVENLQSGVKTGANVALTIIVWTAIVLGAIFVFWGISTAAQKDSREEGKLKSGIQLAVGGVLLVGFGFLLKSLAGM